MACEVEKKQLDVAIAQVQKIAEEAGKKLAERAEKETKTLSDNLENSDSGAAVGATAGGAVGGAIAGPVGATVGAVIGKEIGKLFVIEVEMRPQKIAMDLPTFSSEDEKISFDVPSVTIKMKEVIFHTPSIRMKQVKTGERPETECSGGSVFPFRAPSCTIRWYPIYIDVPEPFMQKQIITLPVTEIEMITNDIIFTKPTTKMDRVEFIFDMPAIVVKSKKDAAQDVEKEAEKITDRFKAEGLLLEAEIKEQNKEKLVPRINAMFDCFAEDIRFRFMGMIQMLENGVKSVQKSITDMQNAGVPADDDDLVSQHEALLIAKGKLDEAQLMLETTLNKLSEDKKASINQMLAS